MIQTPPPTYSKPIVQPSPHQPPPPPGTEGVAGQCCLVLSPLVSHEIWARGDPLLRGDSLHGRVTTGRAGGLQWLQREPTRKGKLHKRRRAQAARPATLGSRFPGAESTPCPACISASSTGLNWKSELDAVFHVTPGARGSSRLPWGGAGAGPGPPRSQENPPWPPTHPPKSELPVLCAVREASDAAADPGGELQPGL